MFMWSFYLYMYMYFAVIKQIHIYFYLLMLYDSTKKKQKKNVTSGNWVTCPLHKTIAVLRSKVLHLLRKLLSGVNVHVRLKDTAY